MRHSPFPVSLANKAPKTDWKLINLVRFLAAAAVIDWTKVSVVGPVGASSYETGVQRRQANRMTGTKLPMSPLQRSSREVSSRWYILQEHSVIVQKGSPGQTPRLGSQQLQVEPV